MVIAREEIFGPVLVVIPADSEDEAVRIANESDYGLSGGVWSGDENRAMAKRFQEKTGRMPNMIQMGTYSAVLQYLKAVKAAGTDEAEKVVAEMKKMPVNDFMTKDGKIRDDGRMMRDMYLLQAKKPSGSKSEWDLMNVVATIPAEQAFKPLEESECPLVKH